MHKSKSDIKEASKVTRRMEGMDKNGLEYCKY